MRALVATVSPGAGSEPNTTVVIPLDDSIRVRFQFQNDPP